MLSYPYEPHETSILDWDVATITSARSVQTREEIPARARDICEHYIQTWMRAYLDDALHLAVINAVRHITDADTLALATARIPAGMNDDTLRFAIAFLHEKAAGFPAFVAEVEAGYYYSEPHSAYYLGAPRPMSEWSRQLMRDWTRTAQAIVRLMKSYRPLVGNLVRNADFIRDAARIETGQEIGIQVTTTGNVVSLGIQVGDTLTYYPLIINSAVYVKALGGLRYPTDRNNAVDTCTITAVNGGSEVRLKTPNSDVTTILNKDAARTFTVAEMQAAITTTPIPYLKVAKKLSDVRIPYRGSVTISLAGVFTGTHLTNVSPADTTPNDIYATVSEDWTSLRLGGRGIRTRGTMTLIATNPSGNVSTSFHYSVG